MASSRAIAFSRFATWKNSKTVLRVTVFTKGGVPDIWQGQVFSVDESRDLVGVTDDASRKFSRIDLSEASFSVEARSVIATHEIGWVRFEELLVC